MDVTFSRLTKIAGIGWIAVEVSPILFELLGLGMATVTVTVS